MVSAKIVVSLEQLVASSAEAVFAVDGALEFVAWNRAARDLLGFDSGDVLGRPCHSLLAGRDDDGGLVCTPDCAPLKHFRGKTLCPNYNICTRTKCGRQVWLNVSTMHIQQGPQREVLLHLLRPIDHQKALEDLVRRTVSEGARRLNAGRTALSPVTQTEPLSGRENQILTLLKSGRRTRDIAEWLGISPATVRTHIQRILDKLGVHSRVEAVVYAKQHDLL